MSVYCCHAQTTTFPPSLTACPDSLRRRPPTAGHVARPPPGIHLAFAWMGGPISLRLDRCRRGFFAMVFLDRGHTFGAFVRHRIASMALPWPLDIRCMDGRCWSGVVTAIR